MMTEYDLVQCVFKYYHPNIEYLMWQIQHIKYHSILIVWYSYYAMTINVNN